MAGKTITRIGAAVVAAGASALALLGATAPASASQFIGATLHPGEQRCVQQYASYQLRLYARASGQGAKFKVQYNWVTVAGTGSPGIVNFWSVDLRRDWGNFPGAGYYVACATNNGTADTNVQLTLLTDAEVW